MQKTERSTKEIVTPNGHKVVIFDYLTGGELRKIQAVYMEGLNASDVMGSAGVDTKKFMDKVPVTTVFKAQELALGMAIVSVDGETENALQLALDLKEDDLAVLIAEADKYTSGTVEKKSE